MRMRFLVGSCSIPVVVLMAALGAGVAKAQESGTTGEAMPGVTVQEMHPKPAKRLFPITGENDAEPSLEFRTLEQMAAPDRELVEANLGEVERRARLAGFDVNAAGAAESRGEPGGWGYEQAVCPVFPQHVILEFSRDNGRGDVTLFSAVIPRGEGHVRVIPVRRRGYSLWTPSSSNALTLNDFNHMVAEGGGGLNRDWFTLGLCYAALAGGHVRAALVPQTREEQVFPLLAPAMLREGSDGSAEIRFTDATPHVKAMLWTLNFGANGQLKKVKHSLAGEEIERPVPGNEVDLGKVSASAAKQAQN
jgi:hypothetical protein